MTFHEQPTPEEIEKTARQQSEEQSGKEETPHTMAERIAATWNRSEGASADVGGGGGEGGEPPQPPETPPTSGPEEEPEPEDERERQEEPHEEAGGEAQPRPATQQEEAKALEEALKRLRSESYRLAYSPREKQEDLLSAVDMAIAQENLRALNEIKRLSETLLSDEARNDFLGDVDRRITASGKEARFANLAALEERLERIAEKIRTFDRSRAWMAKAPEERKREFFEEMRPEIREVLKLAPDVIREVLEPAPDAKGGFARLAKMSEGVEHKELDEWMQEILAEETEASIRESAVKSEEATAASHEGAAAEAEKMESGHEAATMAEREKVAAAPTFVAATLLGLYRKDLKKRHYGPLWLPVVGALAATEGFLRWVAKNQQKKMGKFFSWLNPLINWLLERGRHRKEKG